MGIDLKKVMSKKLPAAESAPVFRFETLGDQLVFIFRELKTVMTSRGEDAALCECDVLGGEHFNKEKRKIESWPKGPTAFFLSTQPQRLFREQQPVKGDVIRLQFAEVGANSVKLFGFEYLEKVARETPGGNVSDDDVPDFRVP